MTNASALSEKKPPLHSLLVYDLNYLWREMSCWFKMAVWHILLLPYFTIIFARVNFTFTQNRNGWQHPKCAFVHYTRQKAWHQSFSIWAYLQNSWERLVGNGCLAHAAFASFHDSFHGGTNPNWRRIVAHVYYIYSTYIIWHIQHP